MHSRGEPAVVVAARMVRAGATGLLLAAVLGACGADEEQGILSPEEMEIARTLSPLPPVPPDPTNRLADDPKAAILGQKLFFDTRYSGALQIGDDGTNGGLGQVGETQKVNCAACHLPDRWFSDHRSKPGNVSLGVKYTERNAPSLVNASFYQWFGWAGKQDSQWTQAAGSPESGTNSAANRCGYGHMIFDHYRDEYQEVTGHMLPDDFSTRFPAACKPKKSGEEDGAWEMLPAEDREILNTIMANCGKSVAAYERLLVSGNSPFDKFVEGDNSALSASAQRGLKLFVGKAGCTACHSGPTFSDNKFYNTGVSQAGPNLPEVDDGRFTDVVAAQTHTFNSGSNYSDDPEHGQARLNALEQTESLKGAFRTKSLRHVAETAPYFHNGMVKTLREVVEFYNRGGDDSGFVGKKDARMVPLNLTEREIDDLVAFLESLTGEPVPAHLTENTANK